MFSKMTVLARSIRPQDHGGMGSVTLWYDPRWLDHHSLLADRYRSWIGHVRGVGRPRHQRPSRCRPRPDDAPIGDWGDASRAATRG